jgi:hypothetical protein
MDEPVVEIPNVLNGILRLEDFFEAIPYEKLTVGTRLILNLSRVSFINPYGMFMLMLMGKYLYQHLKMPVFLVNIDAEVYKYLERMDFFTHTTDCFAYSEQLKESPSYDRKPRSLNLIEIMTISLENSASDVCKVADEFRQRADSILEYWLHRVDADQFVTVLSEVCQNIPRHSGTQGYVALQTYRRWNKNSVNLAVCDTGVGIEASIIRQYPETCYHTTSRYIQHALYEMPRRHYGLSKVREIVQDWGGSLFIRSFNGSFLVSPDHPRGKGEDCKFFPGTQVMIELSDI